MGLSTKTDTLIATLIDEWEKSTPACQTTFNVHNPASGSIIATLPDMDETQTKKAIDIAEQGFHDWSAINKGERIKLMHTWAELVARYQSELARLLTEEQGKPLAQAQSEITWVIALIKKHAEQANAIHGYLPTPESQGIETLVIKEPIGIIGMITPWNFPAGISTSGISASIGAGNSVICKTSEETPLTVAAIVALAWRAGIPKSVIQYLTSNHPEKIGKVFCEDKRIGMISFTGSTTTGQTLYRDSSASVKKLLLELGGNSPFIVFDDAALDKAVKHAAALKFKNCGQICVNANRFIIHEKIYDQFVAAFVKYAKAQVIGNGLVPETTMGPLINQKGLDKVEYLVNSAIKDGAKVACGGKRMKENTLFYLPTVLTDVQPNMEIFTSEIFGPVATCYRFKTDEEAIEMANDTDHGLAAYLYTGSLARSFKIGRAIQAGSVAVNTTDFGNGPFGGFKQSGIGRTSGHIDALEPYCETKTLNIKTLV